jgi:MoxR-like ATPase/predicted RNA-binding protein
MPPVIHFSLLEYPILKFAEDGNSKPISELYEYIVKHLKISGEQIEIMIKKGSSQEPQYQHDIRNKMTVLKDNGLIKSPNDGEYIITKQGLDRLKNLESQKSDKNLKDEDLSSKQKNQPKYWIFATPKSNLDIALQKGIWAYKEKPTAEKILKGDILIFYVTGLKYFAAIATVESDWYESPDIVWQDEQEAKKIIYPFQIKIKIIYQRQVNAQEFVDRLSFITNKIKWGKSFMTAPGNNKNPIPESDYKIILSAFKGISLPNGEIGIKPNEILYFILRTGCDDDSDPKEIYKFKHPITNSKELIEAANKAKFVYLEEGKFYASGDIGDITENTTSDGIFYNALVKNPNPIGPFYLDEELPKTRIIPITKEHYDEIISKKLAENSVEPPPEKPVAKAKEFPVDNVPFEIIKLYFEDNQKTRLQQQITNAIANGKHLILIGPPGTGKSKLAKEICETYCENDENYQMYTATSDWSTYDTIGGYRPDLDPKKAGALKFFPGIFLQCFQDKNSNPINKWLILDEINRADIDKAFGPLFSALTGDGITIPFERNGNEIRIRNYDENFKENKETFFIPQSWRMIATMNNFDKSTLYQMSYAFMRRFAFIHIEVPTEINVVLIQEYAKIWGIEGIDDIAKKDIDDIAKNLSPLWEEINLIRKIGPSFIEDMYRYLLKATPSNNRRYTDAINLYVIPQLEGLDEKKVIGFVKGLAKYSFINNHDVLKRFASDFFGIDIGNFNKS